ncbi:hypothetical protein IKQ21_07610 [bacterium]|nr:hypothetical protein [bacterium]
MKVQNIQSTNFTSKTRLMSPKMQNSIQNILLRMNYEVKRTQHGDHYETVLIKKLHQGEDISFEDSRRLKEVVPLGCQMSGFSSLRMGNSWMDFDNETREIVDYKKPFYMPWTFFMKKAENILQKFYKFFNCSKVVRKEKLAVRDLTPEGIKKMRKYVLTVEKQRLEQVIKELEECK